MSTGSVRLLLLWVQYLRGDPQKPLLGKTRFALETVKLCAFCGSAQALHNGIQCADCPASRSRGIPLLLGCGSEPAWGMVSGEYPLALRHLQALHTQFVYRRRLVLRMVVLCRQLAPSPLGLPRAVLTSYVTRRSRSRPVGLALSLWFYYTTFRWKSQPLFCLSLFCTKIFNDVNNFCATCPDAPRRASTL